MKLDEIYLNPKKYGNGKKHITKEKSEIHTDHTTGKVIDETALLYSWVDKEPNYIKIYIDSPTLLDEDINGLWKYLIAFSRFTTYANDCNKLYQSTVRTTDYEKRIVADICGVSLTRVEQAITDLIRIEVFIPIYSSGKRLRGIYFVNPWILARGEWQDIRNLRKSFASMNDEKTYTYLDENNIRSTIIGNK